MEAHELQLRTRAPRPRPPSPEATLAAAVLKFAVLDFCGSNPYRRDQAERFFFSDTNEMFRFWCHLANLPPDRVRALALAQRDAGTVHRMSVSMLRFDREPVVTENRYDLAEHR